ncbi:MAG: ribonuclease III [Burkholderiales bacterium]|nr:ribonuclease III [Burkholderiales bacterium]MCE7876028.1 ribonuclease III [Betaproteobacteria bacterium PRO3]
MADASVRLGHAFGRPELLAQALTHRSHGARHNERLEFVGDAVLNCVVALALYERFPGTDEGDLSRARASLVNGETLARIARRLELGDDVRLGEGELKSGGAKRGSILADALEAVFGAVFVDAGFEAARRVIIAAYGEELANANPTTLHKDPKTRLQEWLQARRLPVPEYAVVGVHGEAHAQQFAVECRIPSLGISAGGAGSSRRAAEQDAASRAWSEVAAPGTDARGRSA